MLKFATTEEEMNDRSYYVVRTYCHTDRKQLWKVMTRAVCKDNAEHCLDVEEHIAKKKNPKHKYKFFIVKMTKGSDF